jgi:hypothetical protein
MFPKLSEASGDYFLQNTFFKFVFIMGENIFWGDRNWIIIVQIHFNFQSVNMPLFMARYSNIQTLTLLYQGLTTATIKFTVLWERTPCVFIDKYVHFGRICCGFWHIQEYKLGYLKQEAQKSPKVSCLSNNLTYLAFYHSKTVVITWQLCLCRWISTNFQYRGHVYCQSVLLTWRTLLE